MAVKTFSPSILSHMQRRVYLGGPNLTAALFKAESCSGWYQKNQIQSLTRTLCVALAFEDGEGLAVKNAVGLWEHPLADS